MKRIMKDKLFAGIDIGSTNIYIAVGKKNSEGIQEIIGACCVPSSGVKEGMVVSIENAVISISMALREAEASADMRIKKVNVGIKGQHIESFNYDSSIRISRLDKEIFKEDIIRVLDSARAVHIPPEKEIIHVIPLEYKVDNQQSVENPVGMEGTHLVAKVHIVFGLSTAINNVVRCINRAGLGCSRIILGILAASEIVVTKEEKEFGCVLIDIGGQSINFAIFRTGYLQFIKQLPIGADFITRDIAIMFQILPSEAKRIKEAFGNAEASLVIDDQVITATAMDNISQVRISQKYLGEIIESRTREMIGYIKEEIRNTDYEGLLPSGAILIGGGSMLNGIRDLAADILQMHVHLGIPHNVTGPNPVTESPLYATAIGLVKYADDNIESPIKDTKPKGFLGDIIKQLKAVLDQVF